MKVEGIKKERVTVEISDREITQIIINKILKTFEIPPQSFISDEGKLMEWKEYHTSHSWIQDRKIRDATNEDKAVFLVINKLKELDKK